MQNKIKKTLAFMSRHPLLWRFVIVVILFSVIFYTVHPREILSAFRQAKPRFLVYAIILMIPNLLIQVMKWNYILRTIDPDIHMGRVTFSVFGGIFLGAATPSRSGEFARGVFLPGHSNVKIASLTLLDKGFNQLVIIIAGLLAISIVLPWPLSLIPLVGSGSIIVFLFKIHYLRPRLSRILHYFTHSEMVNNALAAFDALSPKMIVLMGIYSIVLYLVFVSQFYIVFLGFVDLPLMTAVKTIPMIYLINFLLPISFGEFGVKEVTAVHLFGPLGIGGELAFGATLTQDVITFLIPSLIGGLLIAVANLRSARKGDSQDDDSAPASGK